MSVSPTNISRLGLIRHFLSTYFVVAYASLHFSPQTLAVFFFVRRIIPRCATIPWNSPRLLQGLYFSSATYVSFLDSIFFECALLSDWKRRRHFRDSKRTCCWYFVPSDDERNQVMAVVLCKSYLRFCFESLTLLLKNLRLGFYDFV